MASVFSRGFFTRNLFRLKDLRLTSMNNRCSSILVINFNQTVDFRRDSCNRKLLQQSFEPLERFQLYSNDSKREKLSIFQRFKKMYKEYWYVLVPVHLVTSACWFGGFYYLAKSGVDVVAILESMGISDRFINHLRDSSMGYLALAYALYKIATPARYTVTLGGTTISINYLKKWGYIKPVPSAEQLKEMYYDKKDDLIEAMRETKEGIKMQSEKIKDKKDNIIDDLDKSIKQIKEFGEKMKSTKKGVVKEKKEK